MDNATQLSAQRRPPALRAITSGPRFHWFGYYDKFQFDPTNRFVLSNEVTFEHRSPAPADRVKVGLIDLEDSNRWTELGESRAWNWQQGCMLQWLPGTASEVFWNDREDGQFVCRVLDVRSGRGRTLPSPVYAVSPDGRWGIAPDFRRLNDCRPGYGYAGLTDPNRGVLAPEDAGLWKIDMQSGRTSLLISFAEVAAIPFEGNAGEFDGAKHWFNHLLFNPDGTRFLWLHRWRGGNAAEKYGNAGGFGTRMFTADLDGAEQFILDPLGRTSHFVWRDVHHVFAWAYHPARGERFYLFKDRTREATPVGPEVMTQNGHNTYLPGTDGQWVLNDTYPDADRRIHLYLYHVPTGRRVPLADPWSPPEYDGEWRCDLHPRASRDGNLVCIDSAHAGGGRQMYLLDVRDVVNR